MPNRRKIGGIGISMNNIYIKPQMLSITEAINRPIKLVKAVAAFNEEEFITSNLRNCYEIFDRILVIEGGIQSQPSELMTLEGHSQDHTLDLIQEFKDKEDVDNKVLLISIKRPWRSLEEQKNTFVDLCMPGDILVIQDVDEYYRPSDLLRAKKAFDFMPHMTELSFLMIHMYRDFQHAYVPGAEWSPQPMRLIRLDRGFNFKNHPTISDIQGHDVYFAPHYLSRKFTLNNAYIFHAGYCRDNMKERLIQKQKYYQKELAKHDQADKPFNQKVNEFTNHRESLDNILLVPTDIIPEEMKQHPRFNKIDGFYENKEFKSLWDHDLYRRSHNNEPIELIYNCMTGKSLPYMPKIYNHIIIEEE